MLKSLNSMDFTVAVASNSMTIEQDMTFIKAALLYSDTITLVSPVASTYIELTDNANKKNEKALYNLMQKVIPFCQKADPMRILIKHLTNLVLYYTVSNIVQFHYR